MKNNLIKRIMSILTTVTVLLTVLIVPISASASNAKKPAKVKLNSVKTISTKALKIYWKNIEKAKGYQIKISTNRNFNRSKTVNTVNASMKTIKKLKSGTKYYVKVRAYTKVNGKKKYGRWSNVKSGSKKKAVSRRTTTNNNTTVNYGLTYVLNPDSMKVHKSGCRTFKYESRYPTTNDLNGALNSGYSMCKVCWR